MISFVLGGLFGFALAHPTVRTWIAEKVSQLKAKVLKK